MFKANISTSVRKVNERAAVIDIRGEVNSSAENALMNAYTEATSQGAQDIVLNFSEMEYMNSSGSIAGHLLICHNASSACW
jgi:anti-anti-sigma factor